MYLLLLFFYFILPTDIKNGRKQEALNSFEGCWYCQWQFALFANCHNVLWSFGSFTSVEHTFQAITSGNSPIIHAVSILLWFVIAIYKIHRPHNVFIQTPAHSAAKNIFCEEIQFFQGITLILIDMNFLMQENLNIT